MAFADVPIVLQKPWGIICLVMNIFLPGTGTMIAAGNQENVKHYVFGVLQLVLFWTVLFWVWSIVWGVLILVKAEK